MLRPFPLILIVIVASTIPSIAQQGRGSQTLPPFLQQRIDPQKDLDQARQMEQLGQYDQAVALYERVLLISPLNAQALSALPPLYVRLQRYDKAIALLNQQVDRSPKNVVFRRMLADVLLTAKREPEAREQCRVILSTYPANESMIRLVASLYTDHGMYADAIDTYLQGRSALNSSDAFALTLADLHTTLSDVPNAVSEYIRWLKAQPKQFSVVDDRVEDLAGLRGPEPVRDALQLAAREKPVSIEVLRLLGNFYLRHKEPAEAFEQYREADRLGDAKGTYLLEFATWCEREQYFDEAIQAYMEVLAASYSQPVQTQASLGLARAYHNTNRMDEAMAAYQQVVTRYPRTREREEALFQIAELQLTHFMDPQNALSAYRGLLKATPSTPRRVDIAFRIADCHIARGSIRDAVMQYNQILDPAASGLPADRVSERAKYHLAEMALFQKQYDEAAEQFTSVAGEFPGSIYANDALQWMLRLGEVRKAGEEPLQTYIDAVLLERQYKKREALDAYKGLLQAYPTSSLNDMVILGIGLVLNELARPHEAIAAFRDLTTGYPASRYAPEAQRHIAETYEHRLHDIPQAIAEYETVLVNYPDNFFNDRIRRKIRELTSQHPPTP